jgi:hypothetical protein
MTSMLLDKQYICISFQNRSHGTLKIQNQNLYYDNSLSKVPFLMYQWISHYFPVQPSKPQKMMRMI